MPEQHDPSQSSLIDELLSRQDEVIRELDALDDKLIQTIEAHRDSKKDDSSVETAAEVPGPDSRAA